MARPIHLLVLAVIVSLLVGFTGTEHGWAQVIGPPIPVGDPVLDAFGAEVDTLHNIRNVGKATRSFIHNITAQAQSDLDAIAVQTVAAIDAAGDESARHAALDAGMVQADAVQDIAAMRILFGVVIGNTRIDELRMDQGDQPPRKDNDQKAEEEKKKNEKEGDKAKERLFGHGDKISDAMVAKDLEGLSKKTLCLRVLVLGVDSNNKGGSKYAKLQFPDRNALQKLVDDVNHVWGDRAKICFSFSAFSAAEIERTSVDVFDGDGVLGEDDLEARKKIVKAVADHVNKDGDPDRRDCINLVFVGQISGNTPGLTPEVPVTTSPDEQNANVSLIDDDATVNDIAHEIGHQLCLEHQEPSFDELVALVQNAATDEELKKDLKSLVDDLADNLMFPAAKSFEIESTGGATIEVQVNRGDKLNRTQDGKAQLSIVRDKACHPDTLALNHLAE